MLFNKIHVEEFPLLDCNIIFNEHTSAAAYHVNKINET